MKKDVTKRKPNRNVIKIIIYFLYISIFYLILGIGNDIWDKLDKYLKRDEAKY